MISAAILHKRIDSALKDRDRTMPYKAVLRELKQKLDVENDERRKQELEVSITIVLGLVSLMEQVERLTTMLSKRDG